MVLLGASNVVMSFGLVVATAARVVPGSHDVVAAIGHGRSYGLDTSVLGRRLPSILGCGLWRALARRPPRPLYALLADVGNDIGDGVDADTLLGWLDEALGRLTAAGARTVVLAPPVASVLDRGDASLLLARRVLFPTSTLAPDVARRRVVAVDRGLAALAARHGAVYVGQERAWYGLDPIHLRPAARRRAWADVLARWGDAPPPAPVASSRLRSLRLQLLVPERRRLWGVEQRGRQPAARLADGTVVSVY